MTHAVDAVSIFQALSSVLYVALGVWVLTLTPRRLQTTLLGAFAILFGMAFLPTQVGATFHLFEPNSLLRNVVQVPFSILLPVTMVGLAWAVPEPLEDRQLLGAALAVGLAVPFVFFGVLGGGPPFYRGLPGWVRVQLNIANVGVYHGALVLLALRARPARDPSRDDVIQLALLGVALAMLATFVNGGDLPGLAENLARNQPLAAFGDAPFVILPLVEAGLWGWNMIQADHETASIHRTAMLGILGLFTAGAV